MSTEIVPSEQYMIEQSLMSGKVYTDTQLANANKIPVDRVRVITRYLCGRVIGERSYSPGRFVRNVTQKGQRVPRWQATLDQATLTAFTDWNDEEEVFSFLNYAWDVREAKRILRINPRETDTISVADAAPMVSKLTVHPDGRRTITMGIYVEHDRLDEVDLTVPVILVTFKDTCMVIDGWHRIARADRDGVKELPAVLLDAKESKRTAL